ncbi:hypothetical protein NEIPOLOT_01904 [Neisseria polysaccharea ATCC 43768]|nr:hypothetical protein NEIPOLOT_01904 [Neisseria polysaccharea ATCC 43768]
MYSVTFDSFRQHGRPYVDECVSVLYAQNKMPSEISAFRRHGLHGVSPTSVIAV